MPTTQTGVPLRTQTYSVAFSVLSGQHHAGLQSFRDYPLLLSALHDNTDAVRPLYRFEKLHRLAVGGACHAALQEDGCALVHTEDVSFGGIGGGNIDCLPSVVQAMAEALLPNAVERLLLQVFPFQVWAACVRE